jgi:hypothetical protein
MGLGSEITGLILAAVLLGSLVGEYYPQHKDIATAGFIVLAMASWVYRILRLVKEL